MRSATRLVLSMALVLAVASLGRAADCTGAPGDADGDGLCDALDPCPAAAPWPREATLRLRKLGGNPADDTLRFRGVVPLPMETAIDPAATGLRLIVLDGSFTANDVVLDVSATPGDQWRTGASGRSWSYRAAEPGTTDITRVLVKEAVPSPAYGEPRAIRVDVDARRGTYAPTTALDAHLVTVAFAATGMADLCAALSYQPSVEDWPRSPDRQEPPLWEPRCRARGRTLLCTTGPGVGPCRVSAPTDLMRCDAESAAAAQERLHLMTGMYHTGPCLDLPGFAPSPDVDCVTSGDATRFLVVTDHPGSPGGGACIWDNYAVPSLGCS